MHRISLMFIILLTAQVATAQQYTVTDLGTLGGIGSTARDINESGQVTGWSTNGSQEHAFLYSDGYMRDLGTLPGGNHSAGYGISGGKAHGKGNIFQQRHVYVTGDANLETCHTTLCGPNHAFLWKDGYMQDLGLLPGGSDSHGLAVNRAGQVTGEAAVSTPEGGRSHAFLYSNGQMRDLGLLPGGSYSEGFDINDGEIGDDNKKDGEHSDSEENVQITGFAETASGWGHAFIYSNGTMRDLGTLPGGRASAGYAINQFGEVTGTSDDSAGSSRAFLYDKDGMHDLGTLPGTDWSIGSGINRYGHVVGHTYKYPYEFRAFIYRDTIMQDLNDLIPLDSGWRIDQAQGINDRGEIIGTGERNGVSRQILLTPICNRDSHRGKECDEQNGNKHIEFPNNGFRKP